MMDYPIIQQLAEIVGEDAAWIAGFTDVRRSEAPDEAALLDNYRATDDRGKRTISRVAEEESSYKLGRQGAIERAHAEGDAANQAVQKKPA